MNDAYQGSSSTLAKAAARLSGNALGRWALGQSVMFAAPYFRSIGARFDRVEAGCVQATLRKRRGVTNHIGSVHAIAMCNLAELVGGLLHGRLRRPLPALDSGGDGGRVPQDRRTDLKASCTLDAYDWTTAQDVIAPLAVHDTNGQLVFRARKTKRVSVRKPRAA